MLLKKINEGNWGREEETAAGKWPDYGIKEKLTIDTQSVKSSWIK